MSTDLQQPDQLDAQARAMVDAEARKAAAPEALRAHPEMAKLHTGKVGQFDQPDFQGDSAIADYASHAGGLFEQRLKQYLPNVEKAGRPGYYRELFEGQVRKAAQGYAVQTLAGRMQEDGEVGPGSLPYWWSRTALAVPGAAGRRLNMRDAAERMGAGQGTGQDYRNVAIDWAQKQFDANRGLGGQVFDMATYLPEFAAEWAMTGGAAGAAKEGVGALGTRALGSAAETQAGRWGTWGLQQAAAGAARAPLMSGMYQQAAWRMTQQPTLGPSGVEFAPGEDLLPALGKSFAESAIQNTAFEASGALGGAEGKSYLRKVGQALTANWGAQETNRLLALSPAGSPAGDFFRAQTTQARQQALQRFAADVATFGGLEGFFHAREMLKARGLKVNDAQLMNSWLEEVTRLSTENSYDRQQSVPPTAPAPAAGNAAPGATPLAGHGPAAAPADVATREATAPAVQPSGSPGAPPQPGDRAQLPRPGEAAEIAREPGAAHEPGPGAVSGAERATRARTAEPGVRPQPVTGAVGDQGGAAAGGAAGQEPRPAGQPEPAPAQGLPAGAPDVLSRDQLKQAIRERVDQHGGFAIPDMHAWFPGNSPEQVNQAILALRRETGQEYRLVTVSDGRDFTKAERAALPKDIQGASLGYFQRTDYEGFRHFRTKGQRQAEQPVLPPVGPAAQVTPPESPATPPTKSRGQRRLPGMDMEALAEIRRQKEAEQGQRPELTPLPDTPAHQRALQYMQDAQGPVLHDDFRRGLHLEPDEADNLLKDLTEHGYAKQTRFGYQYTGPGGGYNPAAHALPPGEDPPELARGRAMARELGKSGGVKPSYMATGAGPGGGGQGPGPGPAPGPAPMPPDQMLQRAKDLLDFRNAEMARRNEISRVNLDPGEKFFQTHTEAAPDENTRRDRFLEFTNAYQHGNVPSLSAEQQEHANALKARWDEVEPELVSRGLLKSTEANHLGQMWKDPRNPNAAPEDIIQRVMGARRPLAGSESFKKQKVHQDFQAGIDAGLEPVSWNPITIQKMKLAEAYRSIFAHDLVQDLKSIGAWKFARLGKSGPVDWRAINDKAATVFAPPQVGVHEFYDEKQWQGLTDVANRLGVNVERVMRGEPGRHVPGDIKTRFGTPEEVLAHELGHELDHRYKLASQLVADPVMGPELAALANERASAAPSPKFAAYIQEPGEKVANLVAAYIHAPELLDATAPHAGQWLDAMLQRTPELRQLRDVKPSLVLGEREMMLRLAGPMLTGRYYTPNGIADLLENHTAKGLQGNPYYDAARSTANFLNMMQLAGPGFHAGFTTVNTLIHEGATFIQRLSRLPYQLLHGQPVDWSETGKSLAAALVPLYGLKRQLSTGLKMGQEYYAPGSQAPETQQQVADLVQGGGRARMDPFYGGSAMQKWMKAARQLNTPDVGGVARPEAVKDAVLQAVPALAEAINKPVLDGLVPVVKRGAAAQMMAYERERLGPNATPAQLREAFGKVMDSIDNRFGEVNYDNTHMNKAVKDGLMISMRSLGWNMGTWRELGGAVKDIPDSVRGLFDGRGVSPRTAYLMSLLTVPAVMGTALGLVMTGKGPESLRDMYFPKTGRKRKDGTDDRLALPSYMRDVAGLANRADEGPLRVVQNAGNMAMNKLNPLVGLLYESFVKNEDYYGTAIRNPNDSAAKQTWDTGKHLAGSLEPFASRGLRQQRDTGAGLAESLLPLVGITPASASVTRSADEQRAAELQRSVGATPLYKKRKAEGLIQPKSRGLRRSGGR